MRFVAIFLGALFLTAQASPVVGAKDAESARRFVQSFYDWYMAKSAEETEDPHKTAACDLVLTAKASALSPTLLRGLREDRRAEEKADGYIVGLDMDAFCASQDPDPRYIAREVKHKQGYFYVHLHGVEKGKQLTEWAVIAKVEKFKGRWRIKNVLYPGGGDLLGDLEYYKEQRARDAATEAKKKHH